jgi:hypothetical protein
MPVRGLGADHFFLANADGGVVCHVTATGFTCDVDSTFTASYASGTLTARLQRSELGQSERFAIVVEADQDDAEGNTLGADYTPDGAPYEYSFVQAPLVVTVGKPLATPGRPRREGVRGLGSGYAERQSAGRGWRRDVQGESRIPAAPRYGTARRPIGPLLDADPGERQGGRPCAGSSACPFPARARPRSRSPRIR